MPGNDTVECDVICAKCGYNVRGLDALDKCPECGWLVAESLNKELPIHRERTSDFRIGSAFLLALPILVLVGFGFSWVLDPTPLGAFVLVCLLLLVILPAYFLVKLRRTRVVPSGARCQACRYDLRGIDSSRCPSCGSWLTSPKEPPSSPNHGAA